MSDGGHKTVDLSETANRRSLDGIVGWRGEGPSSSNAPASPASAAHHGSTPANTKLTDSSGQKP